MIFVMSIARLFYPNSMVRYCQGCTLLAAHRAHLVSLCRHCTDPYKDKNGLTLKNKHYNTGGNYHGYYFYDPA